MLIARTDAKRREARHERRRSERPPVSDRRTHARGLFRHAARHRRVHRSRPGLRAARRPRSGWKRPSRVWRKRARFADAIHARYPGKLLAYNCSPSFNWKKKLDERDDRDVPARLNAMGYKFQFVTLAGLPRAQLRFLLARARLQDARHDRVRGVPSDRSSRARADRLHRDAPSARGRNRLLRRSRDASSAKGSVSTTALAGSTEAEQFYETQATASHRVNVAPAGFRSTAILPAGFAKFYLPLHERFTSGSSKRSCTLGTSGSRARMPASLPTYLPPSEATQSQWRVELPAWCADQRNQMTGPRRRRGTLREDAQLRRSRRHARSRRLDGQHVGASDARPSQHRRGALRRAHVRRRQARRARSRSSRAPPSCGIACAVCISRRPASSRSTPTSASLFDLALLRSHARLRAACVIRSASTFQNRNRREEALWWKDVIRRADRGQGLAAGIDPRDGAGRVAPARLRDGRVPVQPARVHPWAQPRPLGLHGEPHSLQSRRPGVGAARSQYDSVRRAVLSARCERCCPRSRTSTARWPSAA